MQETAIQAFKALKLRDYGRVDMRLRRIKPQQQKQSTAESEEKARVKDTGDESTGEEAATTDLDDWEFYVIEVNPNPYLDEKSELAMAARKHGLNYSELIERIIELAMERNP